MADIIKINDYKLHKQEIRAKAKEKRVIAYCDQYTKPVDPTIKEKE